MKILFTLKDRVMNRPCLCQLKLMTQLMHIQCTLLTAASIHILLSIINSQIQSPQYRSLRN